MTDDSWRDDAACYGLDPDLFEEEGHGRPAIEGLRVCVGCDVRDQCLDAGLANSAAGDCLVWGGTTKSHRDQVRRHRWTREQAKAAGDRVAGMPTTAELAAIQEREQRRLQAVKNSPSEHSTRAKYQQGCRCEGCRQAESDYQRLRHVRRKAARQRRAAS